MRPLAIAIVAGCSFSPHEAGTDAQHPDTLGVHEIDAAFDAPIDAPKVCPPTYTMGSDTAKYRLTGSATWQDAEADCASDGNHLVRIDGSDEDNFIFTNISGNNFFWIGLYDPQNDDHYEWSDNSALGGYTNFNGSGSASTQKNCVDESFSNGQWAIWFCDPVPQGFSLQPGLCECDP